MKKTLVTISLLAAACWVCASYYAGVQAESAYEKLLPQLSMMEPMVFEKESFDKGLMTSHAITAVRESRSENALVAFRLMHEIKHSPIRLNDKGPQFATATIRTTLSDYSTNPDFLKFLDLFHDGEPIEIISTAKLNGNIDSVVHIGAFDVEIGEDQDILSIAPSSLNAITNAGRTQGSGTIGRMTMTDRNGITMTGVKSVLEFNLANTDYWRHNYEFTWSMSDMTIESPGLQKSVRANGLSLGTDSTVSNKELSQNMFFAIDQIDTGDAMPSDLAPITSGKVNIAVSNLNLDAVQSYVNWAKTQSIQNREQQTAPLSTELLDALSHLVTKGTTFELKSALGNAGGNADAEYRLRFVGDNSSTGYDNIITVADLANALEMELSILADKSAIEMTPVAVLMQFPVVQRLIKDSDEQYLGKATQKGITIVFNGEPVSLYELLGEGLDMPVRALIDRSSAQRESW